MFESLINIRNNKYLCAILVSISMFILSLCFVVISYGFLSQFSADEISRSMYENVESFCIGILWLVFWEAFGFAIYRFYMLCKDVLNYCLRSGSKSR